jgi:uncharacterized membrane protein YkvA (DUF1232 family)
VSAGLFSRLGRVATLLADSRVPRLPKLALVAALVYAVSPVDLVPEAVLPVVGWLDDLLIGLAALRWLLKQDDPPREVGPSPPAVPPGGSTPSARD